MDTSSTVITWSLPTCQDGSIIYVMYSQLYGYTNNVAGDWKVYGINRINDQTTQMKLDFLLPGFIYKAYMMQATLKGVGPPSDRFVVQALPSGKSCSHVLRPVTKCFVGT